MFKNRFIVVLGVLLLLLVTMAVSNLLKHSRLLVSASFINSTQTGIAASKPDYYERHSQQGIGSVHCLYGGDFSPAASCVDGQRAKRWFRARRPKPWIISSAMELGIPAATQPTSGYPPSLVADTANDISDYSSPPGVLPDSWDAARWPLPIGEHVNPHRWLRWVLVQVIDCWCDESALLFNYVYSLNLLYLPALSVGWSCSKSVCWECSI
jgi:hypothetical protein